MGYALSVNDELATILSLSIHITLSYEALNHATKTLRTMSSGTVPIQSTSNTRASSHRLSCFPFLARVKDAMIRLNDPECIGHLPAIHHKQLVCKSSRLLEL